MILWHADSTRDSSSVTHTVVFPSLIEVTKQLLQYLENDDDSELRAFASQDCGYISNPSNYAQHMTGALFTFNCRASALPKEYHNPFETTDVSDLYAWREGFTSMATLSSRLDWSRGVADYLGGIFSAPIRFLHVFFTHAQCQEFLPANQIDETAIRYLPVTHDRRPCRIAETPTISAAPSRFHTMCWMSEILTNSGQKRTWMHTWRN